MPNYPLHLVPTQNDTLIEIGETHNNHLLGIWVDSNVRLKDSDGKLSAGAIDLERIPHFSTNKIPNSIITDLNICFKSEVKDKYATLWDEGNNGIMPNENEFEFIDNRQHYFIKIEEIHNFIGEYINPPPPDKKQKTYKFTLKIIHKPLVANYWHFEFIIYADGQELKNAKGIWKQLLCSSIRDKIQEVAKFHIN